MGYVLEDGTHEMFIEAVFPGGMSADIFLQPYPRPARWWRRRRDPTLTALTHRDGLLLPRTEWQWSSAREVTEFNLVCYCLAPQGREANFLNSNRAPARRVELTTWKRVFVAEDQDVEQQRVFVGADQYISDVISHYMVVRYMQTPWSDHYRSDHE